MENEYKDMTGKVRTNKGLEYQKDNVDIDGDKCWYLNGEYHRVDGPAIEGSNGDKEWLLYGLRHREDGPAIEWPEEGAKYWCLNGIEVSEEEFNEVWNCPMDKLPLYINTNLAPIAKWRLEHGTCI